MTFDLAAYQRDRIRDLEREVNGLKLANARLVIALAAYIDRMYWREKVQAMTQSEFMAELATTLPSRPEGASFREGCQPSESPSGRRTFVVASSVADNHR